MSVNEVKHFDKMQEALEELKRPRYKNVGEYGQYIKRLSNPTREQKAIIVYSVLDMIEAHKSQWGEMNNEKLAAILRPIGHQTGIDLSEMLRLVMHLLSDSAFFVKTAKDFRSLFEGTSPNQSAA